MKKIMMCLALVLCLSACASSAANPLDGQRLTGRDNTMNMLTFDGDQLEIQQGENNVKPYMDTQKSVKVKKATYDDVTVTLDGDTYTIEAKGLSMKLKKFGKRLLEDEQGETYVTTMEL